MKFENRKLSGNDEQYVTEWNGEHLPRPVNLQYLKDALTDPYATEAAPDEMERRCAKRASALFFIMFERVQAMNNEVAQRELARHIYKDKILQIVYNDEHLREILRLPLLVDLCQRAIIFESDEKFFNEFVALKIMRKETLQKMYEREYDRRERMEEVHEIANGIIARN